MKLTANERRALEAIVKSEYQDGDPVDHDVWTRYCNPFPQKRTQSGVYASLVKKQLIRVGSCDGMDTVAITQAGAEALSATRWYVKQVTRPDAAGLYNAADIETGREHPQTPTHSRELAQQLVDMLNGRKPR